MRSSAYLATVIRHARHALSAGLSAVVILLAHNSAVGETPFAKGLLWRIEKTSAPPSHVFGTIHLTDPRVTELPPPVAMAFDKSRKLALEIVPEPDMPIRMARVMTLGAGGTLDEILGRELFLRVIVVADNYGIPESALRRLKPWAAMTVIAVPREEQERRASGRLPLDLMLDQRARIRSIPVVSLEKLEEQLAIFDGLPQADQVALLRQVIETHADINAISDEMIAYYLKRDIGGLLDWLARQSTGDDPRLRRVFLDRMLIGRNQNMSARAEPLFAEGGAFVAVGAGHLPGLKGILSLLSTRGYHVTRVY